MGDKHVMRTSKEIYLVGEVKVVKHPDKKRRSRSTPRMITNSPGHMSVEKKKSTAINSDSPENWGTSFTRQNLLYLKQMQTPKSTKHVDNKEEKKNSNIQELRKSRCSSNSKYSVAASPKRTSQKKTEECLKTCACKKSSSMNNTPFVIVHDQAVQVPEISNNYRSSGFNPVHKLCFLMKELEDSVKKEKKTNEIFNEIGQLLYKIPEFDVISMQTDLERSKIKLQKYSEQMKTKCESWILQREAMHSQIQEQNARLKDADQNQSMLKKQIDMLEHQLKEAAFRATEGKDETISKLKHQIKDNERVISELRTEVAKQTKLARDRYIKNQCMVIEKEKLSVLGTFKDTLNVELRNTIKEFQNHVTEHLATLKDKYMDGGNISSPGSPINTGPACSSPNSSSVEGHDLSDISLSVVERAAQDHVDLKGNTTSKDSTQFVTLPIWESSHTLMPESFQKQDTNDGEMRMQYDDRNDSVLYRNANTNQGIARKPLRQSSRNDQNKENMSEKTMVSDIEKHVQSILDDLQQERVPVDVPSPLRECPPSDWSDNLSSVNTVSDLDIVP